MTRDINDLRADLSAVDRQLLRLVAERQRIVEEIGRTKRQSGRATRDFTRERVVIEDAVGYICRYKVLGREHPADHARYQVAVGLEGDD